MVSDQELFRAVRLYETVAVEREPRIRDFHAGRRGFLVYSVPDSKLWGNVRGAEQSLAENLTVIRGMLEAEMDALPFLEPWHGVGVYAEAFGCEVVWHDDEAPSTVPAFAHVAEALQSRRRPVKDCQLMSLAMESIAYFKRRLGSAIPIVLTDTQSANDTASLVVDACNFLLECETEPDTAHRFLSAITDWIIEFSQQQAEAIGDAWSRPGHIMNSLPGLGGISVSDDNQSFCSAGFNREFANRYDEALGAAFGGVAIHSCGVITHVIPEFLALPHFTMVDCAGSRFCDPNPNDPAAVAELMAGTGRILQIRCGNTVEEVDRLIAACARPEVRLVVRFAWPGDVAGATALYRHATEKLMKVYGPP